MADVTIYTKPGCPYCAAAMKHYTEMGIPFDEVDVKQSASHMEKALKISGGQRIVPVIVDHGEVKLGFGGG
jgi:glutaredoxin